MLKRLQERVNRGTKDADATAKKDEGAKPEGTTAELPEGAPAGAEKATVNRAIKLADKQLEIEDLARKVGEKVAPPGGN